MIKGSEDVSCCSELFISGGYEFKQKSKTIDLYKTFQLKFEKK